jgi:hypothetical protein
MRTLTHRVADRLSPPWVWLRPSGDNTRRLWDIVDRVVQEQRQYAEFMLHSSELMPGGSPTFRDDAAIDRLYLELELLFEAIKSRFRGATLSEFRDEVASFSNRPN